MNIMNKVKNILIENIENKNDIRIYKYSIIGQHKNTKYSADKTRCLTEIFDKYNVKYKEGNDAPRGGKTGDYIEYKNDFRNKIFKYIKKEMNKPKNVKKDVEKCNRQIIWVNHDEYVELRDNYIESDFIYNHRKKYNISYKKFREDMIKTYTGGKIHV